MTFSARPLATDTTSNALLSEVLAGLTAHPKSLPPKLLYDRTGSRLFEAICDTPEYYLTRTEHALLKGHGEAIAARVGTGTVLIEPGSGNCGKVRLVLDTLRPCAYLPVDICGNTLEDAVESLTADFPWLPILPARGDFTHFADLPAEVPDGPRLIFFPGSTIGNLDPVEAVAFLRRAAAVAGADGALLIGVDTRKAPELLNAAYNDSAGLTAAFNLNLLTRLNRELGADFRPEQFEHRAFYHSEWGRVEMHLVSRVRQEVHIAGHRIRFEPGETIHTESSYKYRPEAFQFLAREAGLVPRALWSDENQMFSLHLLGSNAPS